MRHRGLVLFALLSAMLWSVVAYTGSRLIERRETAQAARTETMTCSRLVERIRNLRERPRLAGDQQEMAEETVRLIESAARSAGIPTDRLVSISPGRPRRLDDTAYREQPTQVVLRNVHIEPLVKMAHALTAGQRSMRARSLRISAPQQGDTSDFWNAELELTYLIYDPPENTLE